MMEKISATELARNTREILDRVVGLGETIAVERNHTLIAQILPAERTMTAEQAFADLRPMLTSRQGSRWLSDSRDSLDDTVRDPWA
jgi:antitoxin (DNA-binding transcriptional repressor) of toxin-antitoxin stability system